MLQKIRVARRRAGAMIPLGSRRMPAVRICGAPEGGASGRQGIFCGGARRPGFGRAAAASKEIQIRQRGDDNRKDTEADQDHPDYGTPIGCLAPVARTFFGLGPARIVVNPVEPPPLARRFPDPEHEKRMSLWPAVIKRSVAGLVVSGSSTQGAISRRRRCVVGGGDGGSEARTTLAF